MVLETHFNWKNRCCNYKKQPQFVATLYLPIFLYIFEWQQNSIFLLSDIVTTSFSQKVNFNLIPGGPWDMNHVCWKNRCRNYKKTVPILLRICLCQFFYTYLINAKIAFFAFRHCSDNIFTKRKFQFNSRWSLRLEPL